MDFQELSDGWEIDHRILLEEWREHRQGHGGQVFCEDGPIDPKRWSKVRRRVLFLLKEAYTDDEDWNLSDWVRGNDLRKLGNMWWNVGYWAYGIHRLENDHIPTVPWTLDGISTVEHETNIKESLYGSAIVNVKKSDGNHRSDMNDLQRYVNMDRHLIEKQIQILKPQIIVCGYTWHLVKNEVWPNSSIERISHQVYSVDSMIALDYWHPSYRIPSVMKYYTALLLLQKAPIF